MARCRDADVSDLSSASGVLYYKLTTLFGVLAKKMAATGKRGFYCRIFQQFF